MTDQKNLLLAVALSISILLAWNFFFEKPRIEQQQAQQQAQEQATRQGTPPTAGSVPSASGPATSTVPGAGTPVVPGTQVGGPVLGVAGQAAANFAANRTATLEKTPRIAIDTPRLRGSISLTGARIDDLVLTDYYYSLDPDSPEIALLHPIASAKPYYVEFGWLGSGVKLPDRSTVWKASGNTLAPDEPVTLSWNNGEGLSFEQHFEIDENYMITVRRQIANKSAATVSLSPYGLSSRTGIPETLGFYILHEGPLGVFDKTLQEVDYDDLVDEDSGAVLSPVQQETTGGWIGFTDKYWLVALIPDAGERIRTSFSSGKRGNEFVFQTDYLGGAVAVAPNNTVERVDRLFAGAKETRILDAYRDHAGVESFDKAVDWGVMYFLTKPIFYMLAWFYDLLGNFGLAILALTVCIKILFFPLANKSYRSMSKMKLLQPKMVEIKERYSEDRQRMNEAMMGLYKQEGVNPASGCLPIVVQIPVFFALYKVLFVSIEMRQAPFYGWIKDLSAPDPYGLLTGFGLVDWSVPEVLTFLNVGLWPCIMGLTMFLQQRLNPTPADPIQAKIFAFLPLIFTFILAPFPAGLVIYWAWNNLLSMGQQWVIMQRTAAAT